MGLNVHRVIYLNGFEKEVDSAVTLIPLPGRTFADSDTRIWPVNHTIVTTQYIAMLIISPFVVDSVSENDDDKRNVDFLMVGLGGGTADMFLHTVRPKVSRCNCFSY